MSYRLVVEAAAARDLRSLRGQPILRRLTAAIDRLTEDPRPAGCKKLTVRPGWHIRVGDYRVVYDIEDVVRIVTIERVRHRSSVYEE